MVNRLLVGDYGDGYHGMKLSIPGVNVQTANDQQLIFDTKWLGAGSILYTGVSTMGATVSFPALSYIPMAAVMAYSGSESLYPFYGTMNPDTYRWSNSYETRVSSNVPYYVTNSSITFISNPSGWTQHYTNVRYSILRLPGT